MTLSRSDVSAILVGQDHAVRRSWTLVAPPLVKTTPTVAGEGSRGVDLTCLLDTSNVIVQMDSLVGIFNAY